MASYYKGVKNNMAQIRYGHREGPGKGKEYPVRATQYFGRLGGKFCTLQTNTGHVAAAAAIASELFGWAVVPKDTAGKNAWKSSGTAGADKVFVIIPTQNDRFEMPYKPASAVASCLATSLLGQSAEIYVAGATYSTIQQADKLADPNASQAVLVIYDVDETNETVLVGIRPQRMQPKIA